MKKHSARTLAATLAALLFPVGMLFGGAAPATAVTHEVATVEQLADAFADASDGDAIVVTGNIMGEADSPDVEVPHGMAVTLDLNGYTVTLIGTERSPSYEYASNPGVWVPPTSGLTIIATGGGTLDVLGSGNSAGLGGMFLSSPADRAAGTIAIHGGTIIATGPVHGAGIGGAYAGAGGEITITGGHVTASSLSSGFGIGTGANGRNAVIAVTGGTVIVTSNGSAAIGADGNLTVSIANATVHASSNYSGAGIGSGYSASDSVDITI